MIFQGKELHIGDKLVSKRHGVIEVEALHRTFFKSSVGRVIYVFMRQLAPLTLPTPS